MRFSFSPAGICYLFFDIFSDESYCFLVHVSTFVVGVVEEECVEDSGRSLTKLLRRTLWSGRVPPGHGTTLAAPVGTPPTVGPRTVEIPFSLHSLLVSLSLLHRIACRLVEPPAVENEFDSGKVGVPDTGTGTSALGRIDGVTVTTPVP